jgi:glycogen synthase
MARIAPQLSWPVYVAGDGAGDLPRENLQSLGHLDPAALAQWLSRAAIYALPARYEPFGLSILEAALSGCALVLGDIPSLREIWSNAALYVAPDDDAAVARTLDRLIADTDARRDLAARSAARARRYTVDRMGEGYLDLYRQLSGSSPNVFAADHATTAERICECGS